MFKKVLSSLILIAVMGMIFTGCSDFKQGFKEGLDSELEQTQNAQSEMVEQTQNAPSEMMEQILQSLKPDKRVDDFFIVSNIYENLHTYDEKTLIRKLEESADIEKRYNVAAGLSQMLLSKITNKTLTNDWLNKIKNREYNKDKTRLFHLFNETVREAYVEKVEYGKGIGVNINNLEDAIRKLGYVFPKQSTWEHFTTDYYTKDDFSGDFVSIELDKDGECVSLGFSLYNKTFSADEYTDFLDKNTDEQRAIVINNQIKEFNKYNVIDGSIFNLVYLNDDLTKLQRFFTEVDSEFILNNNKIKDTGHTMFSVYFAETELNFTGFSTHTSVIIRPKNYYQSEYLVNLRILENELYDAPLEIIPVDETVQDIESITIHTSHTANVPDTNVTKSRLDILRSKIDKWAEEGLDMGAAFAEGYTQEEIDTALLLDEYSGARYDYCLYAFHDVDANGTDELLVRYSDGMDEYTKLYTYANDSINEIGEFWSRNRLLLNEDGNIYSIGSNGASNTILEIKRISNDGTALVTTEAWEVNGSIYTHTSPSGNEVISANEFETVFDKFFNITTDFVDSLGWKPLT